MKIQDKLTADKKKLNKDIDETIERLNEYVTIIDALAIKIEIAKGAIMTYRNMMSNWGYSTEVADEALKRLEE